MRPYCICYSHTEQTLVDILSLFEVTACFGTILPS